MVDSGKGLFPLAGDSLEQRVSLVFIYTFKTVLLNQNYLA
jgi:hypothetical protein